MNSEVNAWVLIPARGGSVGIPRKNLRLLGGKPLIHYAIATALEVVPAERVVVITDDAEIAAVAARAGAEVVVEDRATPAEETLDTKILRNLPGLRGRGARDDDPVLTVQPTSPLLKSETIFRAIAAFAEPTVRSVLTVAADQHLRWKRQSDGAVTAAFTARVNRQQLPLEYRETGGVIAARLSDIEKAGSRVIEPVQVIVLDEDEAIDIDGYADLLAAAHLLTRKRIAIRVDASHDLGMGHVYRMLALVSELARHEVTIYLSADAVLGQRFFAETPYHVVTVTSDDDFVFELRESRPDLVVLDVLDTEAEFIRSLRAYVPQAKIVSFEDRGSGAPLVDLLVAEFIDTPDVPEERTLAGIEFALLAPAFEIEDSLEVVAERDSHVRARLPSEVTEVLVLFGGSDPSGLAQRALASLRRCGYREHVTVVRGLGARTLELDPQGYPFHLEVLENVSSMPELMSRADIAFTSAGRTVVELASRGTPAICLAQNEKELTHTHATAAHGVLALGLGTRISDDELDAATRSMLDDSELRAIYGARAWSTGHSRRNHKTISAIFERLGFDVLSVY